MFRVSHQEPDRLSLRVITTAECEIIRVIKCYVALDYEQDLPTATQPMPSFTVEQNNDSPPDRLSPPATSAHSSAWKPLVSTTRCQPLYSVPVIPASFDFLLKQL
ncbi:hypothetical protein C8J57DRAFT_1536360 [Mycena rebaudengoi]|nr:hypothetical protein C8J57DRAFT_1536360 [Mycena rebaudengoi]